MVLPQELSSRTNLRRNSLRCRCQGPGSQLSSRDIILKVPAREALSKSTGTLGVGLAVMNISDNLKKTTEALLIAL